MDAAQSFLIFYGQDGKMLSCKRWFISIMVFNFNVFISLVFLLGFFGGFDNSGITNALEPQTVSAAAQISREDILINWLEEKSTKYARYKLNYPKEGIVHAKGFVPVNGKTVRVNILEINRQINPALDIRPQTAATGRLNSRVKIGTIASNANAIAAMNGGYFKPQTGVPLGALVIDNELITGPIYKRAALSINKDGTFSTGKTDIKFALKNKKLDFKIDNVNQPRMFNNYVILYTDKWGEKSPPPPKYGAALVVENGRAGGIFTGPVLIPEGGYVVVGPKNVISELIGQRKLTLEIKYPDEFSKARHIISGGPYLVKNGEIFVDVKEEKLTAITGNNPRSLIGYTKDNELILVTVDGRENKSVGMNLYEAANFMKKLGCVEAINLDGGSSSVMYVKGEVTNIPPVKGGIPISAAVVIGENTEISSRSGTSAEQM